ncbi:MAG: 4Fe-4S binding protein [Clostridiales bacterium]|nr:4Fe-4S binding protein [Clostridiales bacterium]
MSQEKKRTQKLLTKAFPRTEEGLANLLHVQLYFKYIKLYIWHMRDGLNRFLPEPIDNIRPEGEKYDEVNEMVQAVVNHTGARGADPDTSVYHAKVLRLSDAEHIFEIEEDIVDLGELPKNIIPYEHARTILIENPDNIAVIDCVCRTLRGENGCHPRQVCILVGNPWVDWASEHCPEVHPRRISQKEAIQILHDCHERGDVHAAFFKDAANGRMYHICNCCSCCCTALVAQNFLGSPMYAGTGHKASIDQEKCVSCGDCVKNCNFVAISQSGDGKCVVDTSLCMGCEACASLCPSGAISLELEDGEKLAPMDLKELIKASKE